MAELALDDRHRNAFHHQLVRVGVAEPVRVDALLDPGPPGESWEELAHV